MDIIIPTLGRVHQQETAKHLARAGLTFTWVVQRHELPQWDLKRLPAGSNVVALPDNIRTIAPTRQYILEHVGKSDEMVMLDDDLVFYKRRDDDPTKLRDIAHGELNKMFSQMERNLMIAPHVGIAAREGANRNTEEFVKNTRIMRVLGYNRQVLKKNKIRFDDLEVMEDFHVALSLLELGYPNIVLNSYANNQGGSGKAGGCSTFRTMDLHAANAERLAELHPRFVTVVEKTTKGSFGGGTRKDVRVQWKEAYKYGTSRNGTGLLDH